jgi:4-aminobutyrate aminotransferase
MHRTDTEDASIRGGNALTQAKLVDVDQAVAPRLVTEVPGPRARAHVDYDRRLSSPSLPRAYPFVPVRGRGAEVEDIDGNVFVDFCAGIAVNSTGHSHPAVIAAIKDQADDLVHYSASDFYPPIYAHMCESIAETVPISGAKRVYLGNSGAEVVEASLKLARVHSGRSAVISFLGGFHGRTMGAVTLTASKAQYHAGLTPLVNGIYHAPYGHERDLAWFDEVLFDKIVPADEVAAIIVEPVQGEGGYIVPEAGFITGLRELCDRHGILLVADEIQSGAGRTGRMWAIEHFGVEPDILLSAKGIASGMPLAAMVARADILESWSKGAHGSTYGGNPVACAAAITTIELLQGGLIDNAIARGAQGLEALKAIAADHPGLVVEARGLGLMLALELATPDQAEALEYEAFGRGLLVLGCGHKSVRLSPPLVIDETTMASGLEVLAEAVAATAAGAGA